MELNDSIDIALAELADATKAYEAASGEAGREQQRRVEAIVRLSRLGAPRSVTARVARLTPGRVQQLLESAGAVGATGDQWKKEQMNERVEETIAEGLRPSVGIGVRRESKDGPHLGRGLGGKLVLTGDLETDRADAAETLEKLAQMTRDGKLDDILTV
jgi:hypothetical protein